MLTLQGSPLGSQDGGFYTYSGGKFQRKLIILFVGSALSCFLIYGVLLATACYFGFLQTETLVRYLSQKLRPLGGAWGSGAGVLTKIRQNMLRFVDLQLDKYGIYINKAYWCALLIGTFFIIFCFASGYYIFKTDFSSPTRLILKSKLDACDKFFLDKSLHGEAYVALIAQEAGDVSMMVVRGDFEGYEHQERRDLSWLRRSVRSLWQVPVVQKYSKCLGATVPEAQASATVAARDANRSEDFNTALNPRLSEDGTYRSSSSIDSVSPLNPTTQITYDADGNVELAGVGLKGNGVSPLDYRVISAKMRESGADDVLSDRGSSLLLQDAAWKAPGTMDQFPKVRMSESLYKAFGDKCTVDDITMRMFDTLYKAFGDKCVVDDITTIAKTKDYYDWVISRKRFKYVMLGAAFGSLAFFSLAMGGVIRVLVPQNTMAFVNKVLGGDFSDNGLVRVCTTAMTEHFGTDRILSDIRSNVLSITLIAFIIGVVFLLSLVTWFYFRPLQRVKIKDLRENFREYNSTLWCLDEKCGFKQFTVQGSEGIDCVEGSRYDVVQEGADVILIRKVRILQHDNNADVGCDRALGSTVHESRL